MGDVIGDISSRRGQIELIDTSDETSTVNSLVPLAETFGYTTAIRSLTQGRATSSMEFHKYQPLPAEMAEELRDKASGKK